jgi:flagellar hook-associated protein 3 FlgL
MMLTSISTYSLTNDLRRSILELQSQLNKSQRELSLGRVTNLSEALGVNVALDYSLGVQHADLKAITETNNLVLSRLEATQVALTSIVENARTLRSALISSQNSGSAAVLQNEAATALTTFISALNTAASGQFVFGGIHVDAAPISDYFASPASPAKQAVDLAFFAAFGAPQSSAGASAITTSQMQAFLSGPFASLFSSANWTANWSSASNQAVQSRISLSETILTSVSANDPALQKLAAAYTMVSDLGLSSLNASAYQTVVQTATQYIDDAIAGINRLRSTVGVMQSAVTNANQRLAVQGDALQGRLGDLEDVDPAEAATKVNALMTQIETAYRLTARISELTLAKYL